MNSCRKCVHSKHAGTFQVQLVCTVKGSKAFEGLYRGVCAESSKSRIQNAWNDLRCEELASNCKDYREEVTA